MENDAKARVEHELFIRTFSSINPPPHVVQRLAGLMRDVVFEPGEVIYEEKEPASDLYFIVSGEVELRLGDERPWELGEQSMIGIIDAALDRAYSRTAVAREVTHALALRYVDYMDAMEEDINYALELISSGAARSDEMAAGLGGKHLFAEMHGPSGADPPLQEASDKVSPMARLSALRSTPLFARAPVQALASVAQLARVKHYEEGARIFSIGDAPDVVHVLVRGSVRLSRMTPGETGLILPVCVLGGLEAMSGVSRTYQAVAESPVTALVVQKEDLFDVIEDHPGLLRSLFSELALQRERLMRATFAARVR
jgi:CRP-like cAMP-binding protein